MKLIYRFFALLALLLPMQAFAADDLCTYGQTQSGLLCYENCKTGYSNLAGVCWENCKAGFTDIGAICTDLNIIGKGTARGAGTVPTQCPAGTELSGLLCYSVCKSGFSGVGPVCWENCPAGTDWDFGVGCTNWPDGYWKDGWLWTVTDWGWTHTKATYVRGAGVIRNGCDTGMVLDGGLCYKACPVGQTGVGPVCWLNNCPTGYNDDGLTCRRDNGYGKKSYVTPPVAPSVCWPEPQ